MTWIFLLIAILLAAGLLYWLLVTTEGVYLGRRVVVWLYDLTAHKYDEIKQYQPADEQFFIGRLLLFALEGISRPRVLDVATGSGRVPLLLLASGRFHGQVIGLDAAGRMLAQAADKLRHYPNREQADLVQQLAAPLPFAAGTFDAVTCLEALEFFPSDEAALAEMARVLQPGGFLMTSRRKGWEGRAFLGRYRSPADFEGLLRSLGFVGIKSELWELNYDMVTARKGE